MPTLEQLRGKLASFQDLRSIVKTMKALSAASIRQYEHASVALEDYDHTVGLGLHAVLTQMEPPVDVAQPRRQGPAIVVVLGSNHGLCGRLNEDVVELGRTRLEERVAANQPRRVVAVGARIAPLLSAAGFDADIMLDAPASASRINGVVQDVLLAADGWSGPDGPGAMSVVYARRTDSAVYCAVHRPLLPVPLPTPLSGGAAPGLAWPGRARPLLSMPATTLLHSLQQQQLFVAMFRACAESQASEHSSRLVAMTAAQRNVDSRIADATFEARRLRQDAITAELLDVVAGYEAMASESGRA